MSASWLIFPGDVREVLAGLPDRFVQTVVTSPPYWGLRDYGVKGQIGQEKTPEEFVAALVTVFREVRRVLKDDGTLWLNLGDSYAGGGRNSGRPVGYASKQDTNRGNVASMGTPGIVPTGCKQKDLVGIPWMVAFALRADGWYLRSDIIWAKPNPMPESITDRPTKAHEYLFLLSKSPKYYYDRNAIKEPYAEDSLERYRYKFGGKKSEDIAATGLGRTRPVGFREYHGQSTKDYDTAGAQDPSDSKRRILKSMENGTGRNKRTVWWVNVHPYKGAHFATFPRELVEPCVLAGSRPGDVVMDPFTGSGTVGEVACLRSREFIGIELNPDYIALAEDRITRATGTAA